MKKTICFLILATGVAFNGFAQNVFPTTGNTGIGTTTPAALLNIKYQFPLTPEGQPPVTPTTAFRINISRGDNRANIAEIINTNLLGSPTNYFWVKGDGKVGIYKSLQIGATAASGSYSNYKLSVDGDMIAKRCVIQVSDWADYVFSDNYEMPTLGELETYINNNNHLPGVPTTEEVKEKGIEIGDMNKLLLQKIEELTLYMIQIKKENDKLKTDIAELKAK